jgi:bacteriophage HK97-gp10 putative tail-component
VTDINNLANEIADAVRVYTKEVKEEIETAKQDVSKALVKDLKRDSPEKTGSYSKGWRIKKEKRSNKVHNKTDYQLTHLLEKGHAKKNGGRVAPRVHIAPNEEKMINEFRQRIRGAIEK